MKLNLKVKSLLKRKIKTIIPLLGAVVAAGPVVGPDGPTGRVGIVVGFFTTVKPQI